MQGAITHGKETNVILIVDDDPVQLDLHTELLSSAGYLVDQAATGEECLHRMMQVRPDLVLLDVDLPDMTGNEVCRKIKSDPSFSGIPVVLFSGKHMDSESRSGGLESGADDYIVKPEKLREFLARINALLKMKSAERELRRAHREIYQIISSIQSLLIVLDERNRVTRWNWAATKLLSLSFEQVNAKQFDALPITWESEPVLQGIGSCREHYASVRIDEVWFERPDGSDGFMKLSIDPILEIQGGTMGRVLLLGEDITEHLILENQLFQAQKLEALGQLAAGIAHEINTPVQFVSDNMRFLKDAFQDVLPLIRNCRDLVCEDKEGKGVKELFDKIDLPFLEREVPQAIDQSLDGLERVAHIVRSMKFFAHQGGESMMLADVNKALENTVTVSRNEWKYVAEMDMHLDPNLPLIPCYLGDLNQALLNIITNAAQAIAEAHGEAARDKGRIIISTRLDGDFIEIRIMDNGVGIPKEIQERIFDPFFTTKEVGRGTGQGLVIARNAIVKRHQGTISFNSKPGQGTTFIIRLPIKHTEQEEENSLGSRYPGRP